MDGGSWLPFKLLLARFLLWWINKREGRIKEEKRIVKEYIHCDNLFVLVTDHPEPLAVVSRKPVVLVDP